MEAGRIALESRGQNISQLFGPGTIFLIGQVWFFGFLFASV
jgi:hypothetical protein